MVSDKVMVEANSEKVKSIYSLLFLVFRKNETCSVDTVR